MRHRSEPRLYALLFEHAPDPILVLDGDDWVILANAAARGPAGVDLTRAFMDPGPELRAMQDALRDGRRSSAIVTLAARDGRGERRIAVEGRVLGGHAVVWMRDVPAPSDAVLPSFGAAVVHDLNNLLTLISCTSALLTRDAPSHQVAALAQTIAAATERAARLGRKLVALSRVQAPAVVDVGSVIGELLPLLQRLLGDGVDVDVMLGAAPEALADRDELERVLLNLAANARDALPTGGRVSIATGFAAGDATAPGGYAVLTFSDDGAGMSRDVRARALDDHFTTKGALGSGLGLASARRFAQQIGGRITLKSELGAGTTIELLLPAAPGAASRPPAGNEPPGAAGVTADDEDDERHRRVIAQPSSTSATSSNSAGESAVGLR